jgi:hypothetical protein
MWRIRCILARRAICCEMGIAKGGTKLVTNIISTPRQVSRPS